MNIEYTFLLARIIKLNKSKISFQSQKYFQGFVNTENVFKF